MLFNWVFTLAVLSWACTVTWGKITVTYPAATPPATLFEVAEDASVGTTVADGSTSINVCDNVDCSKDFPVVEILNPTDVENPFGIESNGHIYVAKPELLDFENAKRNAFLLDIAVQYGVSPTRAADQFAQVQISVTDVNEDPYWIDVQSVVTIEEQTAATLTNLAFFLLHDEEGDEVTCTVGGADCTAIFKSSAAASGPVSCSFDTKGNQAFDYETKASYECTIKACEAANNAKCTSTNEFYVQIANKDDELPTASAADASASLASAERGTAVILTPTITFSDTDSDAFLYTITDSPSGSVGMVKNFEVDPYTGIIRFGVDMPAPTTYFIDLYATDFAGNKLATGVVVEIEVTAGQNTRPTCVKTWMYLHQTAATTAVGLNLATDATGPLCTDAEGAVTFSAVTPASEIEGFTYSLSSAGELTMLLDHDTRRSYELLIHVTDAGTPALTTTITMAIIKDNLNDLAAVQTDGIRSVVVEENMPAGTQVIGPRQFLDTDFSEHNAEVYFEGTFTGSCADLFLTDPQDGSVYLIKNFNFKDVFGSTSATATCDYTAKFCNLDGVCTNQDGGSLVTITIYNVDDMAPIISSANDYTTLNEGEAVGTVVYTVVVADYDAPTPSVVLSGDGLVDEYFELDGLEVKTKKVVDLDDGSSFYFDITITARDYLNSPADVVHVFVEVLPVEDNNPAFDDDTMSATLFESQNQPGYLVATLQLFDYDVAPHGVDQVSFAITGGDTNNNFYVVPAGINPALHSVFCEVRIANVVDFEITGNSITLTITATGSGTSDTATVAISVKNVDDVYFVCPQMFLADTLVENSPPVSTNVGVAIACTPAPAAATALTFSSTHPDFAFSGNQMIVATGAQLDFETESVAEFKIVVKDASGFYTYNIPATVEIQPVNEYKPKFYPSTIADIEVAEDTPVGTVIAQITIIDEDKSAGHEIDVSTIALANTFSNTFKVAIAQIEAGYVADVILGDELDIETDSGPYALSLAAKDATNLNEKINFNVVITDVNEFVPTCDQSAWFVTKNENIAAGSAIIDDMGCSDDDEDGTISFNIASDPSDLFEVTTAAAGGRLKLKAGKSLNYDTFGGQQHVVMVNVIDNGLKTLPILVVINVAPINQGTPTFLDSDPGINLRETTKPGTCFYQFRMSDSDWSEQSNGKVEFSTVSATTATFLVGKYDGIVCLIAPLDADGGTTSHEIEVRALNPDGTASASTNTLTVTVTNDNDNLPKCGTYVDGSQTEETAASSNIVQLGCTDADGDTTFSYVTDNDAFTVTSAGWVQNTRKLSYESVGSEGYSFYVYVTDGTGNTYGDSPHTIKVPVTVTLDPVDEGNPSCITSPEGAITTTVYHASIDENTAPGTEVVQFFAYDAADKTSPDGIPTTAKNTFAVVSGQTEAKYFNIDSRTGELFVKSRIDLESITSPLVLDVEVSDGAANKVTCSVSVTVNDLNDNCPIFTQSSYDTSVDEGTTTMSLTLVANDADSSSPADTVAYSIISSTAPSGLFTIGASTGVLAISTAPDYDIMEDPSYVIVVAATDNSGVAGFCQTTVTVGVAVNPKNDNTPVLNQAAYAVTVAENAPVGTVLIDYITATDVDLGADGKLYFEITDSSTIVNINRATGVITLAERLDIDPNKATKNYTIPIAVKDSGETPIKLDTANVVVTVTDSNDNVPVCVSYDLPVSIGERETLPFTTTAEIDCSDSKDSSATLTYAINAVNGMEYSQFITQSSARFSVSAANKIVIDGSLDYAISNYYVLETHVLDTFAGATLTTTVYVRITIEKGFDINPEFVSGNGTFQVEVPEDTAVETAIFDLQTASEVEGFVLVYLKTSSTENKFAVDYKTGKVYVSEPLDRESTDSYEITVEAVLSSQYDIAGVSGTSTATISIIVTDVNDNDPIFNPNRIIAKVPETAAIGTAIATLTILDIDVGDNSEISTIEIKSGDTGSVFSVSQDRKIILVKELDYEPMYWKNYTLTIEAKDSGATALTGTATVFVQVVPVNEFPPVFSPASYTFTIGESDDIGTEVGSVTATDADTPVTTDGRFYYIGSSPTSSQFWVDPNDGKIFLKQTVDYEAPLTDVTLIIEARDFGYNKIYASAPRTGTASVLINIDDVNDNPPICDTTKLFRTSLTEYKTAPTSNVDVFDLGILCSDADTTEVFRQLTYQITAYEPTSMNQLAITSSGFIYLPAAQTISYEDFHNVTLTVKVTDNNGNCVPTTACNELEVSVFVEIENVNNFAPALTQPVGSFSVNEIVNIGEVIATFTGSDADDGKDGEFDWFIQSGNTHQDFELVDQDNDYKTRTLVTARKLNRERVDSYSLTVVAVDRSATAPLTGTLFATVVVEDANEAPVCLPINYHVTIPEADATLTGNFIQIQCFDEDSTTSGENFALLKYNIKSETQYPASTVITTDADFTFQIDTQPPLNRLQVKSAKLPLNYETITHYVVIVEVSDNLGVAPSNSISTTIYINVKNINDNAPVFDAITDCAITEAQAVGVLSPACSITAQDADLDPVTAVTYRIIDDTASPGKFSINSNTGQISLKEKIDTDSYTLTAGQISFPIEVEACDSDRNVTYRECSTDTINIVVSDVSDSLPVCYPTYYQLEVTDGDVSYLSTPSTYYFQQTIACTDSDTADTLTYTINVLSGTATDWEMDGDKLSLKNVADFDAGSQSYVIEVIATDTSSNKVTATAEVTVLPVNEHDPVFDAASPLTCTISECAAFPATCVELIFSDDDYSAHAHGQVIASITAGNTYNAFQITNDVTKNKADVIQLGPVDMEKQTFYSMTVTLTDSNSYLGSPRTSDELVNITITGCNDNFPIFNPQLYAVQVDDTITDTQPIVTLNAVDADVGTGSGVTYSVDTSDSDTNTHFASVFELVGAVISLKAGQTLTAGDSYRLQMIASDSGAPAKTSRASVSIYVTNAANSAPVLAADSTVNIPETDSIGSLVGTYTATDETGDTVTYEITGMTYTPSANTPPVTPVFWIHPTTGQIYTAAPVDFEYITQYVLTVTATDNHGATDQGTVTVNINNINDNVPNCDTNPNDVIHISMPENTANGFTYNLKTDVTDIDSSSTSFIFTTLAGTDDYDALSGDFDMTAQGIVSVVNTLDFERQNKYVFTVQISDNDANPVALTTSCVVQITIEDINEEGPHFEPEVMFVSVIENTVAPAEVLVLSVVDDDRSPTQGTTVVSPVITSGDPDGVFLIQPNAQGVETLYIQTTLDRDAGTDSYKLIVTATDTGSPAKQMTGTVLVTVLDLNDNPPRWNVPSPPLRITVDECTGIGQTIPQADLSTYAYDLDIGNNSLINYRLQGGAVNAFWDVDQTTGLITAKQTLDKEGTFTTWTLTVEAYDATDPPVANSLVVEISLSDCNDVPPSVKKSVYNYQVDASVNKDTEVTPISAADDIGGIKDYDFDTASHGTLTWEIVGGVSNDSDYFYVEANTGNIFTSTDGLLVAKNQSLYILYINVTDGVFEESFNVSIEILFSANLHPPDFTPTNDQYSAIVSDADTRGHVVVSFSASDNDTRSTFTYSILPDDTGHPDSSPTQASDLFIIQAGSNKLEVKNSIIYDSVSPNPFEFFVEVSDGLYTDTATVTITVYSADNNPNFLNTKNADDKLYAFTYLTDFEATGTATQYVGRVIAVDINDPAGSTIDYSLEETVFCSQFGVDDEGYVYVKEGETLESFATYWCFVTAFLTRDTTTNNQATVRIDTCPAHACAIRITIDNPPTYDELIQYDQVTGTTRLLDVFDQKMSETLRTVSTFQYAYVQTVYHTQASTATSQKRRNRRTTNSDSQTYLYVVAVKDNSTNFENTVGAQTNFIPAPILQGYLGETEFSEDPFHSTGDFPIVQGSATQLDAPGTSSKKPWIKTAAGIATVTIACILGFILLAGLLAAAVYFYMRRPEEVILTGPDWEARRNWKKAIRKAMLMARLANAKAIDPKTGKVYIYNKLTRATRWLKTKDGGKVESNKAINPENIDDPNPLSADTNKEVVRPLAGNAPKGPSNLYKPPNKNRPAPIEEEEEE